MRWLPVLRRNSPLTAVLLGSKETKVQSHKSIQSKLALPTKIKGKNKSFQCPSTANHQAQSKPFQQKIKAQYKRKPAIDQRHQFSFVLEIQYGRDSGKVDTSNSIHLLSQSYSQRHYQLRRLIGRSRAMGLLRTLCFSHHILIESLPRFVSDKRAYPITS